MQLFILFNILILVEASHFRGGYITWKPSEGTTIEITYGIGWRRSSLSHNCNESMISSSTPTRGEGILYCQSCSPKITIINPMSYQCTEFSTIEDWTSGEKTVIFDYTLANDSTLFYVGYTDCCWVSLQNGGSSVDVSIMTMISTTAINRTEVMRINNSPVTSFSPITRLIQNCNYTITVPVTDVDGDIIRCRWAVSGGVVDECDSGNCQPVPGATLIRDECKLIYQPTQIGFYGVTIQIEDFLSTDAPPLSSVPLQFLIHVISSSVVCSAIPAFTDDTIATGTRVEIVVGTTLNLQIFVNSSSDISELVVLPPLSNFTKTSPGRITSSKTLWYSNITWTPTSEQEGDHTVCFTAKDINGISSEQRCVLLTVTGFNTTSYACDPHSGGVYLQCAKIPPYDVFQIAYCLSSDEVLARTNNTIRCADTCREYCYLTCMAEKYGNHNFTEVPSECLCGTSGTTDAETQLPSWCLTPQGKCDFFDECIPSGFSTCDNVRNITADLKSLCLWFAKKSQNENCSSNQWMKDVRKCFQSYLMTSVFRADVPLCSDFTEALYFEAYAVCFADVIFDVPFCQLPESFRTAFNEELVPLIPLTVREDSAVNSMTGC